MIGILIIIGNPLASEFPFFGGEPMSTRFKLNQIASTLSVTMVNGASTDKLSCRSTIEIRNPQCQEIEQRILATTLRIEIQKYVYVEDQGLTELFSTGYGTVIAGRYLVTHNHFKLPLLELLADDVNGRYATVWLYTADDMLLWEGPLTQASATFVDSESLLLEFLDQDGRGLFEQLGVPSADFSTLETGVVLPGAEVAQINWDHQHAFVQWTTINETGFYEGTPVVVLSDCILVGASGGGLFIDGVHFANNWSRSWDCAEEAAGLDHHYSTAALNSTPLLAHVDMSPEAVAYLNQVKHR